MLRFETRLLDTEVKLNGCSVVIDISEVPDSQIRQLRKKRILILKKS